MKTYLAALFAALLYLSQCTPSWADELIIDSFMGTGQTLGPSGSTPTEHTPDFDLTGNPWINETVGAPIAVNDGVASLNGVGGTDAQINISSSTSNHTYSEPGILTISADLELGTIVTDPGNYWDGLGLGYFSQPPQSQAFEYFTGLVLTSQGSLVLEQNNAGTSANYLAIDPFAIAGETFSTSTFYELTYTVDTSDGEISDVSLTDTSTGHSETVSFNTDVFTASRVDYAGIFGRTENSASSGTAYVENFNVVPEPSTYALMLGGVVVLLGVGRVLRRSA